MWYNIKHMKRIIDATNNIIGSYYNDTVSIVDGLEYSQFETIKQIEYYINSRYLSGSKDSLGRDKPFFNIVNAKVNTSITATDVDTKDINVYAENPGAFDKSFLIQREVNEWMKENEFGITLNEMIETRAKYGGLIVKKVLENGKLRIEVPEWKNLITDQVDIVNGVIIERHYFTPSDLIKKLRAFNQNVKAEDVMKLASDQRQVGKDKTKTSTKYITVYEVHGNFPKTMIDEEADEFEYSNQYHLIAGEKDQKQIVLHSAEEIESPYRYLSWRSIQGRGLGVGVVEEGFEAQMWTNDAKIKEKEVVELASRVILQTDDDKLQNNILTDLDNGSILKIQPGKQVGQLNTISGSVPQLKSIVTDWDEQYSKAASIFDTNTGNPLPANTPFRSAVLQSQNANSLFEYRREEFGLFIQSIFMDWIIPYLTNKMNTEHILASNYSAEELMQIDTAFATAEANNRFTDEVLSGKVLSSADYEAMRQRYLDFIRETKERRFLKIPEGYFKDVKTKVNVNITGEQVNKAVVLESLNNILTLAANNPNVLQDPTLSKIFGKILEVTNAGISPLSLGIGNPKATSQATMPQQAPQSVGIPFNPTM